MNDLKFGVGIDMAMKKFDACISLISDDQKVRIIASGKFNNNKEGFNTFEKWVKKHRKVDLPVIYLMEATGIYHENLAWYLFNNNFYVSIVLPNKAKKYKESLGLKSKNDKIDAKGLSRMACEQFFKKWGPISHELYILRMITRQIERLSDQMTVCYNQLHALKFAMYRDKDVEKLLQKQFNLFKKSKMELEKRVEQVIEQNVQLKQKFEKICGIKGLGIQTLAVVVAETNGFELFQNKSQLVSFVGYDVVENNSGKHTGKTKISKKGNSHIRRALYFPAFNVVRYDQGTFNNLYERIFERTKVKMKGYTAVQRKLLVIIYALWKKDEAFVDGKIQNSVKAKKSIVNIKKETAPELPRAALDRHTIKKDHMPSFPVLQI